MAIEYKLTKRGYEIASRLVGARIVPISTVQNGNAFYYTKDSDLLVVMAPKDRTIIVHDNQTKFGRQVAKVLETFAQDPLLVAA